MEVEASTSQVVPPAPEAVQSDNALAGLPPIQDLVKNSVRRTRTLFSEPALVSQSANTEANKVKLASKLQDEFRDVQTLPAALLAQQSGAGPARPSTGPAPPPGSGSKMIEAPPSATGAEIDKLAQQNASNMALTATTNGSNVHAAHRQPSLLSQSLIKRKEARSVKPDFHPQWKLHRVLSGHLGWVRCVAVDPSNAWFATGAGDRVIKIWNLATGELRLSLTGHISTVRGLAVSNRHPYLFSCGEDKVSSFLGFALSNRCHSRADGWTCHSSFQMVKCWDLETNKVIRSYHGHLSGVYSLALHPTLDVLVTAGRDASARVWDMRTKANVHVLTGHQGTIADVKCQDSDPQVITGSMDSTIK